jgi:hypothetical protein
MRPQILLKRLFWKSTGKLRERELELAVTPM